MSTVQTTEAPPSRGPITDLLTGGGPVRRALWLALGGLVLFSIVRAISGENALTSSSTMSAALLLAGGIAAVVAVAAFVGFLTIDELPPGIVSFTPHVTTLLVLSLASQRLRMPQADGLVYRRGEH